MAGACNIEFDDQCTKDEQWVSMCVVMFICWLEELHSKPLIPKEH